MKEKCNTSAVVKSIVPPERNSFVTTIYTAKEHLFLKMACFISLTKRLLTVGDCSGFMTKVTLSHRHYLNLSVIWSQNVTDSMKWLTQLRKLVLLALSTQLKNWLPFIVTAWMLNKKNRLVLFLDFRIPSAFMWQSVQEVLGCANRKLHCVYLTPKGSNCYLSHLMCLAQRTNPWQSNRKTTWKQVFCGSD